MVQDTTAVFTCATETAGDFHYQCGLRLEDLAFDLLFTNLAHEIWSAESHRAENLVAALAALLAERRHHQGALTELRERFAALVVDKAPHVHLDPPEKYRNIVRACLFPESAAEVAKSAAAAIGVEGQIPPESDGR